MRRKFNYKLRAINLITNIGNVDVHHEINKEGVVFIFLFDFALSNVFHLCVIEIEPNVLEPMFNALQMKTAGCVKMTNSNFLFLYFISF